MARLALGVVGIAVAALGVGCAGARSAHASRTASRPEEPQAAAPAPVPAPESADESGRPARPGATMGCPMEVPGTQVSAAETPEGEAVTFTTSAPDAVPDLRARIHAMADRYERRHARSAAQDEAQPEPQDGGGGDGDAAAGSAGSGSPEPEEAPARPAAPSRAVVEDVEGGARIDITPNDPADVDALRAMIRDRVARMQETGSCAMGHEGSADEGSRGTADEVR